MNQMLSDSAGTAGSFDFPLMQQPNYFADNHRGFGGSGSSGSASPLSPNEFDLVRMQNLQALNALRLLQQSQQLNSLGGLNNLDPLTLNQLLQSCNLTQQYRASLQMAASVAAAAKSPTSPQPPPDPRLDHVSKIYRASAALNDAKCTWSGVLPPRSHRNMTYSPKVFLGGIPWDISEQSLIAIFKQFGTIK